MTNFLNEIKELSQSHVHIKEADKVKSILETLVDGGFDKLQFVSDFDRTITKHHENGKVHHSSFRMFNECPSLPEHYLNETTKLEKKYLPIEFDPTIPMDLKRKHMEEWWNSSEIAVKGLNVTQEEIEEVCEKLGPSLRDGSKALFDKLHNFNVPVLVFSAGLGDVVRLVLKNSNVLLPNVEIVSNFLDRDEKGIVTGFKNAPIHVYNKNEYAIKGTDFYEKVLDRENVILMGDSLGDATMSEGIEHIRGVLKIGFLYERIEENLPAYMNTFDIVLVDDQTMNIPNAILNCIEKNQKNINNI